MDINEEKAKISEMEIMLSYQGEDKIITSKQAWNDLEELRKLPVVKFMSKIPKLDDMLQGFRQGDLVVVSGLTKQGKTSFCQTLTDNFAQDDISCLWFSYEMTQMEFLSKFNPLPFFTIPRKIKGNNMKWIEDKIVESMAKYGTKVVFIDHLHFLLDMSIAGQGGYNVSLLIGSLMRELKKIALYRDIAIFLIAHTTKVKFEQQAELADIRDSSFISQEADTVLMIGREKDRGQFTPNKSWLGVLANRRTGKVGKISLVFNNGKFLEEFYDGKAYGNYSQ